LKSIVDPIDSNGIVALPERPGLGEEYNHEYVAENLVSEY
jgi:L-alanine-DL-glutamate epimerase-like enolase superfamily enzyme